MDSLPVFSRLNSLSNDNFLDWSKLKAFADDNIILTEKWKFGLGQVENMVRKGEMACPTIIQKPPFVRVFESRNGVIKS